MDVYVLFSSSPISSAIYEDDLKLGLNFFFATVVQTFGIEC